jgi:hypothetical protein
MDLRGGGWEGVVWINLAEDRGKYRADANMAITLRVSVSWWASRLVCWLVSPSVMQAVSQLMSQSLTQSFCQ